MKVTTAYMPDMHTTTAPNAARPVSTSSGSLRDEIRDATHAEHDDIEHHMDLMRPELELKDYARLLRKYHAFYDVFERFLRTRAARSSGFAEFYCRDRLKTSWLVSDLEALGVHATAHDDAQLPESLAELFSSEQRLLGALYVIEGSMLGGAVLSKQFRRRFDLTPETGLKFFTGYGPDTREKWLAMLQLLGQFDQDPAARRETIEGARSMFQFFKEHLATA